MFIPLEYEIKKGDTLSEIAQMFGTNIDYLAKINKIKDVDKIQAGKELKLYNFEDKGPIPIPRKIPRKVSRPIDLSQYGTQIDPNTGIPVESALPDFISPVSQQTAQSPVPTQTDIPLPFDVGEVIQPQTAPQITPQIAPQVNQPPVVPQIAPQVIQPPVTPQVVASDIEVKEVKQIEEEIPNLGLAAAINQDNEKTFTKNIKNDNKIIPINVRQFFDPTENRTEDDLSKAEKDALRQVIANSQTPERIAEKRAAGLDPNLVEYIDYQSGAQYADVENLGLGGLAEKIKNPFYNLKTFLGQFVVTTNKEGKYNIKDVFDFKSKTSAKGLKKLESYISSISDISGGLGNVYGQLRNFMGYYGPQEGTGKGGRINITI